jgi:hypothetical protein
MTVSEVVNKLALELSFRTGHFEDLKINKEYLNMALMVGIEHFTVDMEEVIAMTKEGAEVGRFKSILDAERKLGVKECNIHQVLAGRNHTAGGYCFIRTKDKILVKAG